MTFSSDLESERLFGGEMEEHSDALAKGARALAAGATSESLLQDMYHEGHTVKGTARMMGYIAVSDAGKLLEDTWKALRDAEQTSTPTLAAALEALSSRLLPAVAADPVTGTPELAAGMWAVREALRTDAVYDEEPARPAASEPDDLGGLLGTLDSAIFGENIRVNAVGLFSLINEICSLRVDAEALRGAIEQLGDSVDDRAELGESLSHFDDLIAATEAKMIDLQGRAADLAAAPLSEITGAYRQLVRYLARRAGKVVRFELVGDQYPVDRQVLERLNDPLRHVLVNAIEHGIEPAADREALGKPAAATLSVDVTVVDNRLTIVIEDDGSGIDWVTVQATAESRGLLAQGDSGDLEVLRAVLFSPNFSTASSGDVGGEGMGLAKVAEAVEALRGTLVLDSEAGSGTKLTITVPTSYALQYAVLFKSAGQIWGVSDIAVIDRVAADSVELVETPTRTEMVWNGDLVPVQSFAETVGLRAIGAPTWLLILSSPVGPVGFAVEEDLGRHQVAARDLGPILDGVPHLTGAALLGGGDIVVLVDSARLADRARQVSDSGNSRRRVFVVDDSLGARQVVGGALSSAGFEVDLAGSPTEALSVLADQQFDAVVLDCVLPTMDGATLIGRVRDIGITAPILVLSSAATAEDQQKALAAGADAFMYKNDAREGALAATITELIG